jgi:hypothetical protein
MNMLNSDLIRVKSALVRTSRKIARNAYFFSSIYLQRQTPIIVFQMGKVGSTSVALSLHQIVNDCPIFHVHFLNALRLVQLIAYYENKDLQPPHHLYMGLRVHRHIIRRRHPAKFITMVRDPIARNISSAFQNFELTTGLQSAAEQMLSRHTLTEMMHAYGLDQFPLTWFDEEIKTTLGIDVFAQPFSHEQGYSQYQNKPFDLLLIKAESDDAVKEKAIADFLGLENFRLTRTNVGESKIYADDYQFVKDNLVFSAHEIDPMYRSKFVTHFYTPQEIATMKAHWVHD